MSVRIDDKKNAEVDYWAKVYAGQIAAGFVGSDGDLTPANVAWIAGKARELAKEMMKNEQQ